MMKMGFAYNEQRKEVEILIEKIEEDDDVQNVYHNMK